MPKPFFKLKQFTIQQDRCPMKVSTDGMLFGAWVNYSGVTHILDIGTGTGLLALIAAQRNQEAHVDAIEIDTEAASQAIENIAESPWPERVSVHATDIRQYDPERRYDLIICNPPYYANYLASPDPRNRIAKHSDELHFPDLFLSVNRLLSPTGRFNVIIPINREKDLLAEANKHRLKPTRRCVVIYNPNKLPKRLLFEFDRLSKELIEETLVIEATGPFDYSPHYRKLVSDLMVGF